MTPLSISPFFREFARRVRTQFWLKALGVSGFMVLFFLGYIHILNHAFFPVTVMPLTAIDRLIPYQPSAWLPYVSLWVYVQLPLCLIDRRCELFRYGWTSAGISLIGFLIFIFLPTAVPAAAVSAADSMFASIRSVDTTGNSCPSLHVAFAVFSAVWIERFFREAKIAALHRFLNAGWCLIIVYSTLATKQHVVLDACAGAVLGFAGAAFQAGWGGRQRAHVAVATASTELAQISPAARKL